MARRPTHLQSSPIPVRRSPGGQRTVRGLVLGLFGLWWGASALAQAPLSDGPIRVGERCPDVRLADLEGRPWPPPTSAPPKLLYLVWFSTGCPATTAALAELKAIAAWAQSHSVAWALVNGHGEDPDDIRTWAKEREFDLTHIAIDEDAAFGRAMGVVKVPTGIVIDEQRRLRYRGRVFERFVTRELRTAEAGRRDLALALEQVLGGNRVEQPEVPGAGCVLPAARQIEPPSEFDFARDIQPLLTKHCIECHRVGGAAPMSLETPRKARAFASDIAEVVASHMMPPWPEDGDGLGFVGDRRMPIPEQQAILRWARAGGPIGTAPEPTGSEVPMAADPPSAATRLSFGAFEVPPHGDDLMFLRGAALPSGLGSSLRGATFEVSDRSVVAELILTLVPKAKLPSTALGEADFWNLLLRGDAQWVAAYAPQAVHSLPAPTASFAVAPDSEWLLGLRVRPNGVRTQLEVAIAIHSAEASASFRVRSSAVELSDFEVPANHPRHIVRREVVLPAAAELHAIYPVGSPLVRLLELKSFLPSASVHVVYRNPHWNTFWRGPLTLETPRSFPTGTRFRLTALFDNSTANPRNPKRPALVLRSRTGDPLTRAAVLLQWIEAAESSQK